MGNENLPAREIARREGHRVWAEIDLDAIDGHRTVDLRELVSNGATCQADDANPMQLLRCETRIEIGGSEEIIPIVKVSANPFTGPDPNK